MIWNRAALPARIAMKSNHSQERQPKKYGGRKGANDGHAQSEIENQQHNMSAFALVKAPAVCGNLNSSADGKGTDAQSCR